MHLVWKLHECIEGSGNFQPARLCPHVPFASGNRRSIRRCGGNLLKTVELATGIFYPLRTFCYVDLHTSLQNLLYQAEFVTSSEHWRS